MKFKEALFEYKRLKDQQIAILEAQLAMIKHESLLLNMAFESDISTMGNEALHEMHQTIRMIILNEGRELCKNIDDDE